MNHPPRTGNLAYATAGSRRNAVLADIVKRYGDDLWRFARYRAGNETDADDAFQDAMVAALRYIDSFRGETTLKNWLLRLVSTACLQKKRGRKNDPRRHVAIDPEQNPQIERHLVSHEPPADRQAVINEEMAHLSDALDAIPTCDRRMLLMHHRDELPLAAIAKDFRMSVPGVKTRLFRARAAVKTHVNRMVGAAA